MELNEEFQAYIMPVVVFLILCNVVGLLGNMIVIYIYTFRYPKSCFQCLVLALSLVDFTSCCSTVPMETVSSWFWFAAPSRLLCKAKNFCVQLTAQSAIFLLFVTAVYKYRRICKPFVKQIRLSTILVMSIVGIIISTFLAIPAAILWDINNSTVIMTNISHNTFICEVRSEFIDTRYPRKYRHILSAYYVFLLATIVLYIFIARSVISHSKMMRNVKKRSVTFTNTAFNISNSTADPITDSADKKCYVVGQNYRLMLPASNNNNQEDDLTSKVTPEDTVACTSINSPAAAATQITPVLIRKVVMMGIISGTFSVTFMLGLAFGYIFAIRSIDDYGSFGELVVMFACYRFYFINYALNPVVYFILDTQFRRKVFDLFFCCSRV